MTNCMVLSLVVLSLVIASLRMVYSCNEAICASIVSKCMLTGSCKCDLKNCTCCKDCFNCLDYLYSECCSCVEMCPKPNDTGSELGKKSHVEDFHEGIPELFNVLTEEKDPLLRWITFTFPIDLDVSFFGPKYDKEIKYRTINSEQEVDPFKDLITVNCTVAYMTQCMSWNKCKASCRSMGAKSYRWFHVGCCECVGETCINYGINDTRCLECPLPDEETYYDDDDLNYHYDYDYPVEITENKVKENKMEEDSKKKKKKSERKEG